MNKYATQVAKSLWQDSINPDRSEYECFFHYTDEMLFYAGFEQALNHLLGAGLYEITKLTSHDKTTYRSLDEKAFDDYLKKIK